jgi:hypothetical protein
MERFPCNELTPFYPGETKKATTEISRADQHEYTFIMVQCLESIMRTDIWSDWERKQLRIFCSVMFDVNFHAYLREQWYDLDAFCYDGILSGHVEIAKKNTKIIKTFIIFYTKIIKHRVRGKNRVRASKRAGRLYWWPPRSPFFVFLIQYFCVWFRFDAKLNKISVIP